MTLSQPSMQELLLQRSLVTTADAAQALCCTCERAATQLEAAAAALGTRGATTLFAAVSSEGAVGDSLVTLCFGEREAAKLRESEPLSRVSVYAAALPLAPGGPPAARLTLTSVLRPRTIVETRSYPLVSRAALDTVADAGEAAKPLDPVTTASPIVARVEREAPPASVMKKEGPVAAATALNPPPLTSATPAASTTVASAVLPAARSSAPNTHRPLPQSALVTPAEKKQASLFDMMRTAAAEPTETAPTTSWKRPRAPKSKAASGTNITTSKNEEEDRMLEKAPATPKRERKLKAPKTEAPTTTTSIAKLARASAKKRKAGGNAAPAKAYELMASLLDDDEDEDRCSTEDRSAQTHLGSHEGSPSEQAASVDAYARNGASALDVILTSANDDIVICDNTPPLAFLAPVQGKAAIGTGSGSASANTTAGVKQSISVGSRSATLGAFFNAELVKFQKGFTRQLRTDMKKSPDGEYTCCDVTVYEASDGSGVCLTEEEYHRRSAALAKVAPQEAGHGLTPSRSEGGEEGAASDSPASSAALATARHTARPSVSKMAPSPQPSAPPARTLMFFFKHTV